MPSEFLRVPEDRIGVLIGSKGLVKKKIERLTLTKLEVDSEEGEVGIEGKDGEKVLTASNIVKAIGRGFSPEKAFLLLKDDYALEVIKLKEVIGKKASDLTAKKSRVIGRHGSIRGKIERETKCLVSVYGNTIAIIGKMGQMEKAKKAIEMILEGAEISTMENFLEEEEEKTRFEL